VRNVTAPGPSEDVKQEQSSGGVGSTSSLTMKLNKLNCESSTSISDEPKPGPSNSAADFDLEVFDSGSSCSNEECWELDKEGSKVKVSTVQSSLATSSSSHVSNPTNNSQTSDKICDSECESGSDTEEMDLPPEEEDFPEEEEEDPKIPVDKCDEANNGTKSLLPSETVDRQDSVEKWNLRNETEVIVSDHDVFGTHENDEDSMDSLVLRDDIINDEDDSTMSSDLLSSMSNSTQFF